MTRNKPLHSALFGLALLGLLAQGCSKPADHFAKAERLAAQGEPAAALTAYDKALVKAEDPWATRAWLGKARALVALKRSKEAYSPASRALQLAKSEPDAVEAAALWGNSAADAADWVEAQRALAMLGKRGSGYPARARLEERIAKRGAAPTAVLAPKTAVPTALPTTIPTAVPAKKAPTTLPTSVPTAVPTAIPTAQPAKTAPPSGPAPTQAEPATPKPTTASSDPIGSLNAMHLGVASVQEVSSLDSSFSRLTQFQDPRETVKVPSPDGTRLLWRGLDKKKGYFLYISDAAGKETEQVKACKNAFQPVWSPDGNKVLFSAIDWKTKIRNLYIYDLQTKRKSVAFASKRRVGALAAWSPDGSKIVFTYFGELWIMNANGIGRGMLPLAQLSGKSVGEAAFFAWSSDGSKLVYKDLNTGKRYLLNLNAKF